jgi:uncharacterized protein (TIGR02118 family)
MLKFVVVLRRKPDWTHERFREYFVSVHGPLARKIPGLRRYRQNFPAPDAKREPPEWDAVIELYFDGKEAMDSAWDSEEGRAATSDLDVFADRSRSSWSVVDEIIVID